MENFTNNVRFILSCNYHSKIIDPIQSRCSVFRFKRLDLDAVKKICEKISKEEKIKIMPKAIDALYDVSEGDVRRVINTLQSCAVLKKDIDGKLIYDTINVIEPKEIGEVLDLSINSNFLKAREKLLDSMLNNGYSGLDVIKQIYKEILKLEISDERKARMIEKCAEIEFRIVEGSDEFIQLESLLSSISLIK